MQAKSGRRHSVTVLELLLIAAYFLLVNIIPVDWLDMPIGMAAEALVSVVNPYLSDYSLGFAAAPEYFTHCYVLAFLLVPLIIIATYRSGSIQAKLQREVEVSAGGSYFFTKKWMAGISLLLVLVAPLLLVEYPLTRAERGIWVNTFWIPVFALAVTWVAAAACTVFYILLKYQGLKKGELKN